MESIIESEKRQQKHAKRFPELKDHKVQAIFEDGYNNTDEDVFT